MNQAKIVLIPLDERPCNYNFPQLLYQGTDIQLVLPNRLGQKKKPADVVEVADFLKKECKDAGYAIIAMDTLLYGGLIPSRLHHRKEEDVQKQLQLLRELKKENPNLKIMAFQCIMRCPGYSSADEEPDYYGICGAQIHQLGVCQQKKELEIVCEYDEQSLLKEIPEEALTDYLDRRKFNLDFNLRTLEYVKEGIIDFLIIPQDDSAPYGYTAKDQITVRKQMRYLKIENSVLLYPGADEIELTLLSRVVNELQQKVPKVYLKYASVKAPYVIPLYEDRPLGETVKYHLMAAGCHIVTGEEEADFILALNTPGDHMQEANEQPVTTREYDVERTLPEFIESLTYYVKQRIPVTVADNAYANGGELDLLTGIEERGLLLSLAGYAGWNTSSNTIGTAIAQGVKYLYCGEDKAHRNFLMLRYLEDIGYCSVVRKKVTEERLPQLYMNYFDVKDTEGIVSKIVKEELENFKENYLASCSNHICIEKVRMPWKRMFEVEIKISYQ